MLGQIALSLLALYNGITQRKAVPIIINCLVILIYAFYPAVSDALYAIDYSFAVILILGIVYSLVPVVMLVFNQIRK